MTPLASCSFFHQIAVAQQIRPGDICFDTHAKDAHHIRPVRIKANPSKAFGLALGAQHPSRGI